MKRDAILTTLTDILSFSKIITAFFALILVYCISTSIYTVKDSEIGILRTFGSITEITQSGIHFKLPYPVQQADVININKANIIEIGVNNIKKQKNEKLQKNSVHITEDGNILWVYMVVEWKVSDPKAYLINAENPDEMLENAIIASIRSVIGNSAIDSLMGSKKIDAQIKTKEQLGKLISTYNIGIEISDVKIKEAHPPAQVREFFDNVSAAESQRNALISKAEEYKNKKLASAKSEAQKISMEAGAYSKEKLSRAKAETAKFDSLYEQYKLSKDVTKSRLLIETLEEILPGCNIYIVDNRSGTVNYIPINEFEGDEQ
ncbi:MAG: FtsH protease activity modulator HflK [Clostridiales bacterium]|nr:FtsH protease activity modulator HflK [Clostridiales bacterium]